VIERPLRRRRQWIHARQRMRRRWRRRCWRYPPVRPPTARPAPGSPRVAVVPGEESSEGLGGASDHRTALRAGDGDGSLLLRDVAVVGVDVDLRPAVPDPLEGAEAVGVVVGERDPSLAVGGASSDLEAGAGHGHRLSEREVPCLTAMPAPSQTDSAVTKDAKSRSLRRRGAKRLHPSHRSDRLAR
jgi:hypothetical protein